MLSKIVEFQKRAIPLWKRKSAIVLTPPVFILFVLAPALIFFEKIDNFFSLPAVSLTHFNIYFGLPLFVFGASLYIWTILLFAKYGAGTQTPLAPTKKLVKTGAYVYCRNPMVLGVILFIAGFGLILNSYSFILIGLIIPLAYLVFIKLLEEKELEARFGKEYTDYKKKTPFLLPRIHLKLAKSLLGSAIAGLIILMLAVLTGFLDILLGLRPFNFISRPATTVGAFFFLLGFGLRAWATLVFYQKKMKIISLTPQRYLITSGPYRLSRNPLYLGMFFMILGVVFILGSPSILIISALFFYLWNKYVVPMEERDLEEVFGQKYLNYKKIVPRWL